MAVSLSVILRELGIEVKSISIISRTPGINCLGIIESISDSSAGCPVDVGTHVWHAQPGWAPIDRMELERWMVDAPDGSHWFVSERRLIDLDRTTGPNRIGLVLWGSEELSNWLGQAILAGRIRLQLDETPLSPSIGGISNRAEKSKPPPPDATAIKPKVKLTEWLSQRGYERLQVRPILLEGRSWHIDGHLLGPEGNKEKHRWTLLEDPFSSQLSRMGDAEPLPFVPQLEQISPTSWKTIEMVRSELPSVCEERRHWRVSQTAADGEVQGSILHWWRIEEKVAEMTSSPILIPGWQVDFPGNGWMIVHGLSGEILNLPESG